MVVLWIIVGIMEHGTRIRHSRDVVTSRMVNGKVSLIWVMKGAASLRPSIDLYRWWIWEVLLPTPHPPLTWTNMCIFFNKFYQCSNVEIQYLTKMFSWIECKTCDLNFSEKDIFISWSIRKWSDSMDVTETSLTKVSSWRVRCCTCWVKLADIKMLDRCLV